MTQEGETAPEAAVQLDAGGGGGGVIVAALGAWFGGRWAGSPGRCTIRSRW